MLWIFPPVAKTIHKNPPQNSSGNLFGKTPFGFLQKPFFLHEFAQKDIPKEKGEAFLLTVGASLLTVKLLCLQSLKALIRYTFPL